jgi:dethiobiotin synthetase
MPKTIFVTATNTNIGKTYTTVELINTLSSKGFKVCAFKPIETGVYDNNPLDGNLLLNTIRSNNTCFSTLDIQDIISYQFLLPAAPYVAKQNIEISLKKIKEQKNYLESICDILIIEGAGGLLVPIEKDFFMIDLIDYLSVDKTLLVTSSKLGSINDTLLSIRALEYKNIDFQWLVNLYQDKESFYDVTYPFYEDYFHNINIFDKNMDKLIDKLF